MAAAATMLHWHFDGHLTCTPEGTTVLLGTPSGWLAGMVVAIADQEEAINSSLRRAPSITCSQLATVSLLFSIDAHVSSQPVATAGARPSQICSLGIWSLALEVPITCRLQPALIRNRRLGTRCRLHSLPCWLWTLPMRKIHASDMITKKVY
jgi:hypothetical protein